MKQPFSDLIMAGVKDVENRTKPPRGWKLPEWGMCTECDQRVYPEAWDRLRPYHESARGGCGEVFADGPYPFRLAIHAAREVDAGAPADAWGAWGEIADEFLGEGVVVRDPQGTRTGVILGTVEVTGSHRAIECSDVPGCSKGCGNFCSSWAEPDCHHWELADPRPLDDPIPAKGQQGLWGLDDDVAAKLRAVPARG